MSNQTARQPANALAIIKRDTIDVVATRVRQFQEAGEIHFPANYSPENSMKSAWLILQKVQDKNKRPALEVCTKASIANSLLDMVVQGLNPAKKQGYFIVYGKELVFQRSYFGTMAVTKQLAGAIDIVAQIVYEGDQFDYAIEDGRKVILQHTQSIQSVNPEKIAAAYCQIFFADKPTFVDVMTIDQIKKAWSKSQMKPITDSGNVKAGSTHAEFAADMAMKTVVNHACKYYLNTSDDSGLVMEHFTGSDERAAQAALESEIEQNANQEIIDIEPAAIDAAEEAMPDGVDPETGEVVPETATAKPSF